MENKKLILSAVFLALGMVGLFVSLKYGKVENLEKVEPENYLSTQNAEKSGAETKIPTQGKFCFTRKVEATDAEPYSVEEHIVLGFDGTKVTGIKSGTQAGPDMTNGYEGSLAGAVVNNELELTYDYTVEGSNNRELEVYSFAGENLVKKRYALKESKINGKSILVPDYAGEPKLITYDKEVCK